MTPIIERIYALATALGRDATSGILLSMEDRGDMWRARFLRDGASGSHEYFALGEGKSAEDAIRRLEASLAEKVAEKLGAVEGQRRALLALLNGGVSE